MDARPIWDYVSMGIWFERLIRAQEGMQIHSWAARSIERFCSSLESAGFRTTPLLGGVVKMKRYAAKLRQEKEKRGLTAKEAKDLRRLAQGIKSTFGAEGSTILTYQVTPKRLEIDKLVSNVGGLFAEGVFNVLPKIARFDFTEAGLCLAYGRATAAAYHVLRGMEGVLRKYHATLTGKKGMSNGNWQCLLNELKKTGKVPDVTLLEELDRIRDRLRNPTQHPEKIYDIDKAQTLLFRSIGVVDEIAEQMKPGQ